MKVTDLEKFALEQIYRPYANKLFMVDTRFDRLHLHYQLDDVLRDAPPNEDVEIELNITADRKVVDYETGHKIKFVVSGERKK